MELEAGTKINLLVCDEWMTGVFLGHVEEFGCDWLIIDMGNPTPRRINCGFISDIEPHPSADVLSFPPAKRLVQLQG